MEGSYPKVLTSVDQVPAPSFHYFVSMLSGTVRDSIAESRCGCFLVSTWGLGSEILGLLVVYASTSTTHCNAVNLQLHLLSTSMLLSLAKLASDDLR